jgi:hypothetical protein
MIDSIPHSHCGTKQMIVKDNNGSDALTIPLDLSRYVTYFRHKMPKTDKISIRKKYYLAQFDALWNPSSFSDQVTDTFYQQVIYTEN